MSALDKRALAMAHRQLAKYGQRVTLTHSEAGAYDPDLGTVATVVSTQIAVAVEQSYALREVDGTMIQQGDKKLLLTAKNLVAPTVGDTCTVSATVYTIMNVSTLAPAGLQILHELQLRR